MESLAGIFVLPLIPFPRLLLRVRRVVPTAGLGVVLLLVMGPPAPSILACVALLLLCVKALRVLMLLMPSLVLSSGLLTEVRAAVVVPHVPFMPFAVFEFLVAAFGVAGLIGSRKLLDGDGAVAIGVSLRIMAFLFDFGEDGMAAFQIAIGVLEAHSVVGNDSVGLTTVFWGGERGLRSLQGITDHERVASCGQTDGNRKIARK